MKDFRDLQIWVKSHRLTLDVYEVTKSFPREEIYGLTSQLRRSAMSIPSNIAEGSGRDTDADMARFLQISMGSASELEYQLQLAFDLKLLEENEHLRLSKNTREIKRMLTSFLQAVRKRTSKPNRSSTRKQPET